MTTLGIIGATGKTGSAVLKQALKQGIDVTAIVRNPDKLILDVPTLHRDIFDLTTEDLTQFDAVICGFSSSTKSLYPKVNQHLVDILSGQPTRLIIVGSGATLYLDESRQKTVADRLPIIMRRSSKMHFKAKEILTSSDCQWTYVAPSYNYLPDGPATGEYQVGTDVLLNDSKGDSTISYADMARALVNEVLHPKHVEDCMTVCWL